jgi:hypothetical protein
MLKTRGCQSLPPAPPPRITTHSATTALTPIRSSVETHVESARSQRLKLSTVKLLLRFAFDFDLSP